ncbi:type III PLP-dependent enzyme [Sinisalibacter aestuarii]|uniref:ornithine decarboxylase n=1 Tax=Sinisalibacter aestuarii TaxID=2949426 RepID=A0ABQ5LUA5_9RHOB|nr:type III PLP-dependent enzyme [Sinisalibacter aestuarii]GKY88564.1 ornithine decarboxylase [Sinisalibacter aestuarii]
MTIAAQGAFAPSTRIDSFAATALVDRPTLVLDIDRVEAQYHALKVGLGFAHIHYAVKANPTREIIERLVNIGSHFDAASRGEIELCLSQGAEPGHISFGNTIKKPADIAFAHHVGVTLFAADAGEELEKIAENAPGAEVYIRVLVENSEADWPLSRKFGCRASMVPDLFARAIELGLVPVGLSFHVGSQTRRAEMWAPVLDSVAGIWRDLQDRGYAPTLLNIGGGFPAYYGDPVDTPTTYASRVMGLVTERFGQVARVMAEPGRGMVAEAGAILAEVVLVSKKSEDDTHRWVYLDIGRFSGLAETEGEAIRYQIATPRDFDSFGPCILAGPSCDSADVLYEKRPIMLPLTLKAGDKVVIRNTGAYTSSYSSVGFNGFPPLDVIVL